MKRTCATGADVARYAGAMRRRPVAPFPTRVRTWALATRVRAWALAGALVLAAAAAQAPVADLTVVAYGVQRLDLATGRTVLEDGGEVVDRASGVRLTAAWIAYVEGAELEARDAVVEGDLGQVRADVVRIDLVGGRLRAEGDLAFERGGLVARADRLGLDGPAALAWLVGDVVAEHPEASAAEVWVDVADGRLLLVGPYRYVDGAFVLEGGAGATLQLDPVAGDGAAGFDARTAVDAAFAERVAAMAATAAAE